MKLSATILASMLSIGTLFAGTYNVDIDHSHVGFKVKHMMISNVAGEFDAFKGSFVYDEETKTLTALNGTVDVASINTDNKKRDNHLRSGDFFDVKKYPTMSMTLERVDGDVAYVTLTMHGVSKLIKMELETSGIVIKDPWGNMRTGLSLSGKINRTEFGLTWNEILEAGGLTVGEDVKISLELEGILAK